MSIHVATPEDLPIIKEMVDEFIAGHLGVQRLPNGPKAINAKKTMSWISENLDLHQFRVWILDKDQGFLVGVLSEMCFAEGLMASESLWYTRPTARGRGILLLRALHEWAIGSNAKFCALSLPENRKALTRLGYRAIDTSYVCEL